MKYPRTTQFDSLQVWMEAVSEILARTLLFTTHSDGAGNADAGPMFRLDPTQAVAYELFTVSRHTAADADLGKGASNTLIRGAAVFPGGETDPLSTVSGSVGTAHLDTNMRYLIDATVVGASGVYIAHDLGSGTIDDDNNMPGIFAMPIVLGSFGADPLADAPDIHTHQTVDEGGLLPGIGLFTATTSFSGSLGAAGELVFHFSEWAFFPRMYFSGFTSWSSDPSTIGDFDEPSIGIYDTGSGSTYEVEHKSLWV